MSDSFNGIDIKGWNEDIRFINVVLGKVKTINGRNASVIRGRLLGAYSFKTTIGKYYSNRIDEIILDSKAGKSKTYGCILCDRAAANNILCPDCQNKEWDKSTFEQMMNQADEALEDGKSAAFDGFLKRLRSIFKFDAKSFKGRCAFAAILLAIIGIILFCVMHNENSIYAYAPYNEYAALTTAGSGKPLFVTGEVNKYYVREDGSTVLEISAGEGKEWLFEAGRVPASMFESYLGQKVNCYGYYGGKAVSPANGMPIMNADMLSQGIKVIENTKTGECIKSDEGDFKEPADSRHVTFSNGDELIVTDYNGQGYDITAKCANSEQASVCFFVVQDLLKALDAANPRNYRFRIETGSERMAVYYIATDDSKHYYAVSGDKVMVYDIPAWIDNEIMFKGGYENYYIEIMNAMVMK